MKKIACLFFVSLVSFNLQAAGVARHAAKSNVGKFFVGATIGGMAGCGTIWYLKHREKKRINSFLWRKLEGVESLNERSVIAKEHFEKGLGLFSFNTFFSYDIILILENLEERDRFEIVKRWLNHRIKPNFSYYEASSIAKLLSTQDAKEFIFYYIRNLYVPLAEEWYKKEGDMGTAENCFHLCFQVNSDFPFITRSEVLEQLLSSDLIKSCWEKTTWVVL